MPVSRRSHSPGSVDSTVMSTATPTSLNPTTPEDLPPLLDSVLVNLDWTPAMKGGAKYDSPDSRGAPPHLDQSAVASSSQTASDLAQASTAAGSSQGDAASASAAALDPNLPQRGLTRRGRPRKVFRYLQDLGGLLQASGSIQPPAKPSSSGRGRSTSQEGAASSSKRAINEDGDDSLHARSQDGESEPGSAKKKVRKVTKACLFCKRSHMTCDEERPCRRCTRRGIASMCVDEEPSSSASPTAHSHSHGPLPVVEASPETRKGKRKASTGSKAIRRSRGKSSSRRSDVAVPQPHPLRRLSTSEAQADVGDRPHAIVGLGIGSSTVTPSPITTGALEAHTLAFCQPTDSQTPSHLPPTSSAADSTPVWDPSNMPTLQQTAGTSQLESFLRELRHAELLTPSEGFEGTPESVPLDPPQLASSAHLQRHQLHAFPAHHHARSLTAASSTAGADFTPSGLPSLMIHNFDAVPPPSTVGDGIPSTLVSPAPLHHHHTFGPPSFHPGPPHYGIATAGPLADFHPNAGFSRLGLESLERLKMWVHSQPQGGEWSSDLRQRLIAAADEIRQVLSRRFDEAAGGGKGRGPASNDSSARLAAAQDQLFSRMSQHYRANIFESLPVPIVLMRGLSQLSAGNSHLGRAFGVNLAGGAPLGIHDIVSAEVTVHLYERYLEALHGSSRGGPITVIGNVHRRRRDAARPESPLRSLISLHIIVDHHALPNAIVATIMPLEGVAHVDVAGGGPEQGQHDLGVPVASAAF